jgi:hypothetical protein
MIFLGDIAVPHGVVPCIRGLPADLFSGPTIANLEGAIIDPTGATYGKAVYNDPAVLDFMTEIRVELVTLANNHIFDLEQGYEKTVRVLRGKRIQYCGAGENLAQAGEAASLYVNEKQYDFIGFGWETIQCRAATISSPGVNPLRPINVLDSVSMAIRNNPTIPLVLLMHWCGGLGLPRLQQGRVTDHSPRAPSSGQGPARLVMPQRHRRPRPERRRIG